MKTYRVVTEETLETTYRVQATDAEEAEEIVIAGGGDQLGTDTSNIQVVEVSEDEEE